MKGDIPVNASGGLLSGIPVTVAGTSRVVEAVWQLQGKGGKHQVHGAKIAVAHGTGGLCGQMHCVLVLEKGGKKNVAASSNCWRGDDEAYFEKT